MGVKAGMPWSAAAMGIAAMLAIVAAPRNAAAEPLEVSGVTVEPLGESGAAAEQGGEKDTTATQGAAFAPTQWDAPFVDPAPQVEADVDEVDAGEVDAGEADAGEADAYEADGSGDDLQSKLIGERQGELQRKGKAYLHAGGIALAFGVLFTAVGTGLMCTLLEPDPGSLPGFNPTFPASIALISAGGLGLLIGAALLGASASTKANAKKLEEGKVGLDEVGSPVVTEAWIKVGKHEAEKHEEGEGGSDEVGVEEQQPGERLLVTQKWLDRQSAIADTGMFMVASAAVLELGGTIAGLVYFYGRLSWTGKGDAIDASLVMFPMAAVLQAVGSPFGLIAYSRARKVVGLGRTDWLVALSWVLYSLSIASMPAMFTQIMPLTGALLVTGACFTIAAGLVARRMLDETPAWAGPGIEKGAITVLPFATAVKGGAVAGIAGAF